MPSGISNKEKAEVRQLHAQGKASAQVLLQSEIGSYHAPGTCTFYGTANSNQMLMEVMGLHLPGASFEAPGSPLRHALTRAAARRAVELARRPEHATQLYRVVDVKALVNGIVGLLATGGSTNHTLHLVAIGRAAGIQIDWDDFAELSRVVPLLARVYPNGSADVNQFHAAGGLAFVIAELLDAGLLHDDVSTVVGRGLRAYGKQLLACQPEGLRYASDRPGSGDSEVLRSAAQPFSAQGGLTVVSGNLGRAVVKTSAVRPEHRHIAAPARVFDDQQALLDAFAHGGLTGDFVAVVRFQGPRANGMPELHKLTPTLGVLLDRGQRVALLTDGRMSGASGKVLAAIHLSPEAIVNGPLSRVRDGDFIELDAERGVLEVHAQGFAQRTPAVCASRDSEQGMGRELFGALRDALSPAEQGATAFHFEAPRVESRSEHGALEVHP